MKKRGGQCVYIVHMSPTLTGIQCVKLDDVLKIHDGINSISFRNYHISPASIVLPTQQVGLLTQYIEQASLIPRPLPPKERPGTHCLRMLEIFHYIFRKKLCALPCVAGFGFATACFTSHQHNWQHPDFTDQLTITVQVTVAYIQTGQTPRMPKGK